MSSLSVQCTALPRNTVEFQETKEGPLGAKVNEQGNKISDLSPTQTARVRTVLVFNPNELEIQFDVTEDVSLPAMEETFPEVAAEQPAPIQNIAIQMNGVVPPIQPRPAHLGPHDALLPGQNFVYTGCTALILITGVRCMQLGIRGMEENSGGSAFGFFALFMMGCLLSCLPCSYNPIFCAENAEAIVDEIADMNRPPHRQRFPERQ